MTNLSCLFIDVASSNCTHLSLIFEGDILNEQYGHLSGIYYISTPVNGKPSWRYGYGKYAIWSSIQDGRSIYFSEHLEKSNLYTINDIYI